MIKLQALLIKLTLITCILILRKERQSGTRNPLSFIKLPMRLASHPSLKFLVKNPFRSRNQRLARKITNF